MRKIERGFTLIELLIAIAIIGILASVAVASYLEYVARAARADAKAVLMETSNFMDRTYSASGCFNYASVPNCQSQSGTAVTLPFAQSPKSGTTRYNITVAYANSGQEYTLSATPTGAQTGDACGTLTLSHAGTTGAAQGDCWQN